MEIKQNVLLANFTTFRIGGPADYFVEVLSQDELIEAITWAKENSQKYIVLGGGSNILVSDEGFRGLVILNNISGYEVLEGRTKSVDSEKSEARFTQVNGNVNLKDLVYDESSLPRVSVKIQSGSDLGVVINELLGKGITGLHWFVGIPGTIGGAVFNNIHCGDFLFSQFIESVEVLDENLNKVIIPADECDFGYDQSRFQKSKEIILSVNFKLYKGDVNKAREFMQKWMVYRVGRYPLPSAGCVFKNIDKETQQKLGIPTPSMGYVIDKMLGLKGKKIGGAKISEKHSAFIVNDGGAKAQDVMNLINLVKSEARKRYNFEPELEIFIVSE